MRANLVWTMFHWYSTHSRLIVCQGAPATLLYSFIYLFSFLHPPKRKNGNLVRMGLLGQTLFQLSVSSVTSNQWEKWKASWERLGADRRCDVEYTGRTPTTNSCMFSFPKTHYLSFRASPIFCQIPIGIWHIDAQLTPTLFIQYNLSRMTYCLSLQCYYGRHYFCFFTYLFKDNLPTEIVFPFCPENQSHHSKLGKHASISLSELSHCHLMLNLLYVLKLWTAYSSAATCGSNVMFSCADVCAFKSVFSGEITWRVETASCQVLKSVEKERNASCKGEYTSSECGKQGRECLGAPLPHSQLVQRASTSYIHVLENLIGFGS